MIFHELLDMERIIEQIDDLGRDTCGSLQVIKIDSIIVFRMNLYLDIDQFFSVSRIARHRHQHDILR